MAAHRYWRLFLPRPGTQPSWCEVSEIEFCSTYDGPDRCVGGTPSDVNAFDNDPATAVGHNDWMFGNPTAFSYDFGVGVAWDICQVMITNWSDPSRSPDEIQLQWSDNGTAWTTVYTWKDAQRAWNANTTKVFNIPAVTFDGVPGTGLTVIDDNTYEVTVPAHYYGTVPLGLYTPQAKVVQAGGFLYDPSYQIISVTPNRASSLGGASISLVGIGFTLVTEVTFGGTQAAFTIVDDEHITATLPAHAIGVVDVQIYAPTHDPTTAVKVNGFEFLDPWRIDAISPNTGFLPGGETITIDGDGFDSNVVVTFGGLAATITSLSAQQIICRAPPRQSTGAVDVTVSWTDGKTRTRAGGYTYLGTSVTSIVPNRMSRLGGSAVVHGGGFVSGAVVELDGIPVQTTYVSGTELDIVVPATLARGLYDVNAHMVGIDCTALVDGLQLTEPPATRRTTMFTVV